MLLITCIRVGAAAFGRLCVETFIAMLSSSSAQSAAFGRLCVETVNDFTNHSLGSVSRLRAAVC